MLANVPEEQKMSHSTTFIRSFLPALLVLLCLCVDASAQSIPGPDVLKYDKKPVSTVQAEIAQIRLIESRAFAENELVRNVTTGVLVMFLFAAFCAVWAQNCERNAFLWFFFGFLFNVVAVMSILIWFNPQNKERRKSRNLPTHWPMPS